jgi:hypothetical protein
MIGTKGMLSAQLFGTNPKIYGLDGKLKDTKLPEATRALVDGDVGGHQQQWVKACKSGYGTYTSSGFAESGPLTEIVLMGNLAVRSYLNRENNKFTGRKQLFWDGANMKITNYEAANQFVKRDYRTGW